MANIILGVFPERDMAEKAISKLEERGYNPKDISIVMKDRGEAHALSHSTGSSVAAGAATGLTTGAIVGGLAGLLASTVFPGLGAFFIGGPLATALGLSGAAATTATGALTGATAGGLLGALSGFGLSDDDARVYESQVQEGGILVIVPARLGNEEEVRGVFNEFNAGNIKLVEHSGHSPSMEPRASQTQHSSPAFFSQVSKKTEKSQTKTKATKSKSSKNTHYSQISNKRKTKASSKKGWFGEPMRHGLARKGIETGHKEDK